MNLSCNKEQAVEDRLSALPDSILIHILSFLPTKDAVRTILIRRFGTLWTYLPILDLDDAHLVELWGTTTDHSDLNLGFFRFVEDVIRLHQRPTIDKLRLFISTMVNSTIQYENRGHELDSWISFTVRKRVKVLEFGFGMFEPDEELYKLPHDQEDFLVCDSVVELKLVYVDMKLQTRVQMGSLRILKLVWVSLNDYGFKEIVRGCPLLKELEILSCWDLTELNAADASNLEKLKLEKRYAYLETLRINCPKLSSLEYTGCVDCVDIIDVSSLADFAFNLTFHNMEFTEFAQFKSLLSKLLHARTVCLSSEFVTVLFSCMQDFQNLSTDWKRLEINIWLTDRQIPGVCCLLNASPCLEELVLVTVSSMSNYLEPIESQLDVQLPKIQPLWCSLKRVVIRNNQKSSYDELLHLVEILLKSASILVELVIFLKGNDESYEDCELNAKQRIELSKNLSRFTRASKYAKILLS